MKRFLVTLPVSGHVSVEVEAEDGEAAIQAAFDKSFTKEDIEEWDIHRHLVRGNVCYATYHRAEAEEL
jgi:hypothetical protein